MMPLVGSVSEKTGPLDFQVSSEAWHIELERSQSVIFSHISVCLACFLSWSLLKRTSSRQPDPPTKRPPSRCRPETSLSSGEGRNVRPGSGARRKHKANYFAGFLFFFFLINRLFRFFVLFLVPLLVLYGFRNDFSMSFF